MYFTPVFYLAAKRMKGLKLLSILDLSAKIAKGQYSVPILKVFVLTTSAH